MHELTMEDVQRQIAGKVLCLSGLFALFLAGVFLMTFSSQANSAIVIGVLFVLLPVVLTWGGLIVRAIMLGLAVVAFLIGLLVGYCETAGDYNLALEWMQEGKYEDARNLFDNLIGFRDCDEKIIECDQYIEFESITSQMDTRSPEETYRRLRSMKGFAPADEMLAEAREKALTVGCWVKFSGHSWQILARDGDQALLFCIEPLAYRPFHETSQPVTWADCSLRQWMNGELLQTIFTPEEQALIELTQISIGDSNASITQDYLFLLSPTEVYDYLPGTSDRLTSFSKRPGSKYYEHVDWLARPTGDAGKTVPYFDCNGDVQQGKGVTVLIDIRPALWVTLDPEFF